MPGSSAGPLGRHGRKRERRGARHLGALIVPWLVVTQLSMAAAPAADATAAPKPGLDLTEVGLERLMNLPVESVYGASRYEQKVTEAPSAVSMSVRRKFAVSAARIA